MTDEALTGTGPVYSPLYYERAARYHDILGECRGLCQHEIYWSHAPDDIILRKTRLECVIDEIRGILTRLEQLQEEDPNAW